MSIYNEADSSVRPGLAKTIFLPGDICKTSVSNVVHNVPTYSDMLTLKPSLGEGEEVYVDALDESFLKVVTVGGVSLHDATEDGRMINKWIAKKLLETGDWVRESTTGNAHPTKVASTNGGGDYTATILNAASADGRRGWNVPTSIITDVAGDIRLTSGGSGANTLSMTPLVVDPVPYGDALFIIVEAHITNTVLPSETGLQAKFLFGLGQGNRPQFSLFHNNASGPDHAGWTTQTGAPNGRGVVDLTTPTFKTLFGFIRLVNPTTVSSGNFGSNPLFLWDPELTKPHDGGLNGESVLGVVQIDDLPADANPASVFISGTSSSPGGGGDQLDLRTFYAFRIPG